MLDARSKTHIAYFTNQMSYTGQVTIVFNLGNDQNPATVSYS